MQVINAIRGTKAIPPDCRIKTGSNPSQQKKKTERANALSVFLVRVTGFEPAAS